MDIISIFLAGLEALKEYLSAHVLTCLVPAFFIAGAMSALLPKEKITKYLGRNVPKYKAYPLSVVAGLLLAVCSCTILPLFAGIKKKGAGIGPAIAFLYTAPATNILAIIYTGSVLGWQLAAARIILSITFAVLIGIIISSLFKEKDDDDKNEDKSSVTELIKEPEKIDNVDKASSKNGVLRTLRKQYLLIFFATLFAILIIGAAKIGNEIKITGFIILISLVLVELKFYFKKDEIKSWLSETWMFFKKIFPLLLIGIFVAGMLTALIPENFLATYVGSNTVPANLAAVLFGVFMYFPTLVEVPMAQLFLSLGMAYGPLLAYLLADPVISLPSILVVRKIMGTKRTLAYAILITIFCTISGLIYGFFVGVF
jgi:uncharacterized membrane protein YraQ (UPF0718 family)